MSATKGANCNEPLELFENHLEKDTENWMEYHQKMGNKMQLYRNFNKDE